MLFFIQRMTKNVKESFTVVKNVKLAQTARTLLYRYLKVKEVVEV